MLYAAVSAYWAVGGTGLLDTVGGSIARLARARNASVIIAVWGTAVLKLVAAGLPLAAVLGPPGRRTEIARVLAWIAALILTIYGAILTGVGLLVQADVVHSSPHPDWRALTWHAYLWDPWFLAWGLLIVIALVRSRP